MSDLTPEDEALLEFAKKSLIDTFTTIKNFITTMIPLTTGLITVYFALLKFLGVESFADIPATMTSFEIILPEILFIISLGAFIGASFPKPKNVEMSNITDIDAFRKSAMRWKYRWIIGGSCFFVAGVGVMMTIAMKIIGVI